MRERRSDKASIDYRKRPSGRRGHTLESSSRLWEKDTTRGLSTALPRPTTIAVRRHRRAARGVCAMFHSSHLLTRRRLMAAASLAVIAAPMPAPARSRRPPADAFAPLLAGVYRGQVDPALCLVSEKYDGVRALWGGRVLRHRSGRAVAAPASFPAALPAQPLDGELWLGRGASTSCRRSSVAPSRAPPNGRGSATWSSRCRRRPEALPSASIVSPRYCGGATAGPVELAPQRRVADPRRAGACTRSGRRHRRRGTDAAPCLGAVPDRSKRRAAEAEAPSRRRSRGRRPSAGPGRIRADRSARSRSGRRAAGASSSAAA